MSSISFPAVTVCSEGLDMDAVNEMIIEEFKVWKNNRSSVPEGNDKALLDKFMEDKFAIKEDENIFDLLRAMSSPSPDKSMAESNVLGSIAACANQKGEAKERKRRQTSTSLSVKLVYQEAGFVYYIVPVEAGLNMSQKTIRGSCESKGMRPVCKGGLTTLGENHACQRTTFLPDTPGFLKDKINRPEDVFYYHPTQGMGIDESRGGGDNITSGKPTAFFSLCAAPPG